MGSKRGKREWWLSLEGSSGWQWTLDPDKSKYVPRGVSASDAKSWVQHYEYVASWLFSGVSLPKRLRKLGDGKPGSPLGPLYQEEAEELVAMASNGPGLDLARKIPAGEFLFHNLGVWDPRLGCWRPAASVFPSAALSVVLERHWDGKGWFIWEDGVSGYSAASEGIFPGISHKELMWMRASGRFDERVIVHPRSPGHWAVECVPGESIGHNGNCWISIDSALSGKQTTVAAQLSRGSSPASAPVSGGSVFPALATSSPVSVDARRPSKSVTSSAALSPILTTAAGVALANASMRAVHAAQSGVATWAKNHNAPEVLAADDLDGDGTIDFAFLDGNGNGVFDGADRLVVGESADAAVEAGNSLIDTIADWLS
jgi:hypothetical protein